MKHIVIGANGLVGENLFKKLKERENITNLIGTYNSKSGSNDLLHLDITTSNTTNLLKAINPDYVWICSSLTDVNYCEQNPDKSLEINVFGINNILNGLNKRNKVIYFSTDYVFNNNKKNTINDICNPCNIYGLHKYNAEHMIATRCFNWTIIRTSNVFGIGGANNNFGLSTIKEYVKSNYYLHKKIRLKQIDSPTYVGDLCDFAIKNINSGLVHFAGSESIDRKHFASLLYENICKDMFEKKILDFNLADIPNDALRPNGGLHSDYKIDLMDMIAKFKIDIQNSKGII